MKLHASGEDYLETILVLQKKLGMVRSVDVARHMEVSKPSVCPVSYTHLPELGVALLKALHVLVQNRCRKLSLLAVGAHIISIAHLQDCLLYTSRCV